MQKFTGEPPLTLEEINERLLNVEDAVSLERDLGEASRIMLVAMIGELHRTGVVNAGEVAKKLQGALARFEDQKNVQLALQVMIREIENAIAWHTAPDRSGSPRQ